MGTAMSGITGIFRRDGQDVDPADIKKMNDKIAHRGPDGSRVWCEGPVAFGHQMLHTTQESLHEILPFEDEESGLVITADARIDNRKDLAPQLGIEDNEHVSDSYFILKAYEKWGEKCPEELLGDFAFAIWDKMKEKVFCTRDHVGVKPFYYYLTDELFIFSTEIKALFESHNLSRNLNKLKLAYYLSSVYTDRSLTFYENIYPLTAAFSLIINKNTESLEKYWDIDPNSSLILNSEEDYKNAFRNIFAESIKCRLRSAYPIGFELSGGLDSSSIVCMAKNIIKKNSSIQKEINAYSMIFKMIPETDESFYIKKVVDSGGINPNLINSDNISPLDNISSILWHQDQPFYTVNISILWNMYQKMQKDNIRIVLSGNGGDEVISYGNNYFRDLAVSLKWKTLLNEIISLSNNINIKSSNLFYRLVFIPLIPQFIKKYIKSGKNKPDLILNDELLNELGGEDHIKNLEFNLIAAKAKSARKHHHFMISQLSHQYNLEMKDRTVAAFKIEPRFPFFDKRMIEFCFAIPTDMKFRYGWNRYIQRISMDNIVPKDIQWRVGKNYFNPVLEKNLIFHEKKNLERIFSVNNNLLENYLDLNRINEIYQDYKMADYDEINKIWLVTILYLWIKRNFPLH